MDKVNKILKEVFSIQEGSIDKNYNFRDLETWDSMGYMVLVAKIEEEFQIELTGEEIVRLLSISQIEQILKERNKI